MTRDNCENGQDYQTELLVPILNSLQSLGEAADLVHPQLANHHDRTGFIAASLAASMGFPLGEQETLLCAGLVHDIGAFSVKQRLDVARFDAEEVFPHCLAGYTLLSDFPSISHMADLVRYHHVRWDRDNGSELRRDGTLRGGHILHLADRVAVALLGKKGSPLEIGKQIIDQIRSESGKMFDPEIVDVFRSLGGKEVFWFEVTSLNDEVITQHFPPDRGSLGMMPMSELARFFSRVIDFRSPFTATHSESVSVVAEKLGQLAGLSEEESRLLNVAGHLHDLGKMSVPVEIIEKPGRLTEQEYDVIKVHPYHTFYILRKMPDLAEIRRWCRYHHERLDGSGYPYNLTSSEICLQSRILAVADVFVALAEDRPYRGRMRKGEVIKILRELARDTKLDAPVVALTTQCYEEIYACLLAAQRFQVQSYEAFLDSSTFPAFE